MACHLISRCARPFCISPIPQLDELAGAFRSFKDVKILGISNADAVIGQIALPPVHLGEAFVQLATMGCSFVRAAIQLSTHHWMGRSEAQ